MTVDPNLLLALSILAPTILAMVAVWRSSGNVTTAIGAGINRTISNPTLANTVETRLNAIPADKRQFLLDLVDLASPLTDTSTISKDAAQWIHNMLDGNAATGAITPTLPAPAQPTVTVSQPDTTSPVTTQPYNPAIPIKENKYLAPYETRLDFPHNGEVRQVHVPVNMGFVYENRDSAGKEYPLPNVNINTAYGARFDVPFIAGSWGFTYLTTLVKGVEYKVEVDYSAEITGGKIDTLPAWLWWELDLDNKPTGIKQGISNGARHIAEWTITGTGLPILIAPRIRAAWASSGSNSAVTWHNLTITPVDGAIG